MGVYVVCVTGLTACVMVFQGAMPSFLAELFPNSVLTTGLALIHNLNFTVIGGLSLLACTWRAQQTGSAYAQRGARPKRQRALTKDPLQLLLATCDDTLRGKRDRALLLFAWAPAGAAAPRWPPPPWKTCSG